MAHPHSKRLSFVILSESAAADESKDPVDRWNAQRDFYPTRFVYLA